ncbi:MAG: hypothetical protein IH866_03050 [Chloroflexi bacterium]|nr:hypothetical protein [Chloroflexota bacterium]
MNRTLAVFIAVVAAAGTSVLALGLSRPTSDELGVLLALLALGALAERYAVGLFSSDVSVGVVAVLVAAIIGGLWGVALVAPAIVLIGQHGSESAWYKRWFNAAVYTLAGAAFAAWFHAFGITATPEEWPQVLAPAFLGAVANFAVNSGLVAFAIALSARESFVKRWRESYQWLIPQYLIIGLTATALASAYYVLGLWGLAVFAAPVLGVRHAVQLGAAATSQQDTELSRAA